MNIEEIKAREQKATPGPWKATFGMDCRAFVLTPDKDEDFKIYNHANADFIAHARTDIPALIAEVEWLTAENASGKEANESCLQYIETLKEELHASVETANMWTDAYGKECEKNATMKKALELMTGEIKSCVLKMSKAGIVRITAWGSDEQCIDYFMKKAEQLTHETHEVDK